MRTFLSAVMFSVFAASVGAQENWTLTTADFKRTAVTVQGLEESGARVVPGGASPTTVPLDRLLRLDRGGRGPAASAKFTLLLHGGDRLGGEPGDLMNETLTWTSPVVGQLKLPLARAQAISRVASPPGLDEARKEDQVMLTNHDVVRGAVASIQDGKILIQVNGQDLPVTLTSADAILFASPAKATADTARAWRVRFVDSSMLTVRTIKIADGKLLLSVPGAAKDELRPTDLANVLGIEQLNGPVSWLSDRTPEVSRQVPFSSEMTYPARMDRNVMGKPLRVGSQTFEKGIGVHANSVLIFPLDGAYKSFRTRYAIDTSSEAGKASVNVRILLDDRVVHEQKDVRAYRMSPVVSINLESARKLTLEVTAADVTDTQDRLDWIEPALVREAVQAEPATKP